MISQAPRRFSDPRINIFIDALRWQETGLSGHPNRVSRLAVAIAQALSLSPKSLQILHMAALLHDLGKFLTPHEILNKPGPLTRREWDIMRKHTIISDELCNGSLFLHEVRPIIRSHHERWDGSGYPDGLIGNTIPLESQILSLADITDALLSPRCYKPATSLNNVLRIITEETDRGWHNPILVKQALPVIAGLCANPTPITPFTYYEGTR